jgi:hypothetical protein
MTRALLSLFVVLAVPLDAAAQPDPAAVQTDRRTVAAVRLLDDESISIDGQLNEPFWSRVNPAGDFLQQDPANGEPATERTEVRIAYDRRKLYLGVTCLDSEPSRLLGNQMQRDQPFSADDRFMWSIDTFLDSRSGYFFEINPSGAMGDGLISAGAGGGGGGGLGGQINKQWDGIWIARVRRSEIGWTAEIEIPFQTLNFDPDSGSWGINFQRTVRRKNEESLWTGHARNQGIARMSAAGLLTGLANLSQGIGLDIKPYGVASGTTAPGRDAPAFDGDAQAGFDIFYNITPSLRANFTVNTDFAETEVDQRRVNLTRFPLFFPEKRDFFLEGSGFFTFSQEPGNAVVPFFSRRIGLKDGEPQDVIYGAKLTGQTGRNEVGVLHVRTGEDDDLALPSEDFTVLRLKRRLLRQSYAGLIYTRRDEHGSDVSALQTAGADFELATSTFRGDQNLELSGFFLWNTNVAATDDSTAYGMRLEYPNDLWNARISARRAGKQYDPAMGFTPRNGYWRLNPVVTFGPRPENHPYIRRIAWTAALDAERDLDNRPLTTRLNLTLLELNFHSQDNVQFFVTPTYERLEEDFEIYEGIVLPAGAEYDFTRYRASVNTASRRPVAVRYEVEWGDFFSGTNRGFELSLSLRPRSGVLVSADGEWNWVNLAEGKFETRIYRLNASTQFSPWISLTNNVQYDSVSTVIGWQSRFRWILRPGNDFYIVYTSNWLDDLGTGYYTLDRRGATKIVYTQRF